jgi:hypothetical protein
MYSNNFTLPIYPEWYKVERDTEKTIKKLTTLKELLFYLKNSDEFLRRLAILRIAELKLKDSVEILKEILDDPLESRNNKELAAWTIKSISLKWNTDLFISHRLLNNYTGSERILDINKVSINDSLSSIKFEFSSSLQNSQLNLDTENFRHSEDVNFDMPFSLKEWFYAWLHELTQTSRKVLINLPAVFLRSVIKFTSFTAKNIFRKPMLALFHSLSKAYSSYKTKSEKQKDSHRSRSQLSCCYRQKTSISLFIKKAVFKLLYYILTPIRLILKHKGFSAVTLAVVYLLLAYTTYGKIITYKYAGIDLADTQTHIYHSSKEFLGYAWNEMKDILGTAVSNNTVENSSDNSVIRNNIQGAVNELSASTFYSVTAKTGLNLRKSPDAASEKVSDKTLAYNSKVLYLGKSQKDSTGNTWYYIKAPDGKTGWVFSKWLEETRGDNNAGK